MEMSPLEMGETAQEDDEEQDDDDDDDDYDVGRARAAAAAAVRESEEGHAGDDDGPLVVPRSTDAWRKPVSLSLPALAGAGALAFLVGLLVAAGAHALGAGQTAMRPTSSMMPAAAVGSDVEPAAAPAAVRPAGVTVAVGEASAALERPEVDARPVAVRAAPAVALRTRAATRVHAQPERPQGPWRDPFAD
jgi:hypothetical protein